MSNLIKTLKGANLNNIEDRYQDSKIYPVTLASAIFMENGDKLQETINRLSNKAISANVIQNTAPFSSYSAANEWIKSIAENQRITGSLVSNIIEISGKKIYRIMSFDGTKDQWEDMSMWKTLITVETKDPEVTLSSFNELLGRVSTLESSSNVEYDYDQKQQNGGQLSWGNSYVILQSDSDVVIPFRESNEKNYIAFDIDVPTNTTYSFTIYEDVVYTKNSKDNATQEGNIITIVSSTEARSYRISIIDNLLDIQIIYKTL